MAMRRWTVVSAIVLFTTMAASAQQGGAPPAPAGPAMTMTIPAFPDGGAIPVKFSQAAPGAAPGEGTSPAISWANPPAGTQSFVLNMHDLDVARNKTTDDQAHWVVWNIPATATGLPEGVPRGRAARRQLSDQRDRTGLSRTRRTGDRSAASLHVRAVCAGHEVVVSSRPPMPSRRAPTSSKPCRDTSSEKRCTEACSAGRSRKQFS